MTATLFTGCGKKDETITENATPVSEETVTESAEQPAQPTPEEVAQSMDSTGVLAFLNFSESQFGRWSVIFNYLGNSLIEDGYVISEMAISNPDAEATLQIPYYPVIYYDTLDAMIMGLLSGEIISFDIYSCVADYICSRNDQLVNYITYDTKKERTPFAKAVFDRFENGFSFMMLESRSDLKEEFDGAIKDMRADGALDKLIKEHITDVNNGTEPVAIKLPNEKGRETIKVAVTGSLPPMDYVSAEGTFAGFNTAILAEIGQRIGKNIELVQVDCLGRATALSSGNVDVVLWIRGDKEGSTFSKMTDEEYQKYWEDLSSQFTPEEKRAMEVMEEYLPRPMDYNKDMPDGAIITEPYYTDIPVGIMSKEVYDMYLEMMKGSN